MRAEVPSLDALKDQLIDDVYIENQPNGRSPIMVIKVKGKNPLTVSLSRRPPGDPIAMIIETDGSSQVV